MAVCLSKMSDSCSRIMFMCRRSRVTDTSALRASPKTMCRKTRTDLRGFKIQQDLAAGYEPTILPSYWSATCLDWRSGTKPVARANPTRTIHTRSTVANIKSISSSCDYHLIGFFRSTPLSGEYTSGLEIDTKCG
jgi:hypothetical protein